MRRHCQVVEAETRIRHVGAPLRSYLTSKQGLQERALDNGTCYIIRPCHAPRHARAPAQPCVIATCV